MNYILDSNILIYYLRGDLKLRDFLADFKVKSLGISLVSRMEVLIGRGEKAQSVDDICRFLDIFDNFTVDRKIIDRAVLIFQENRKKLKFKDLLIAATAQEKNLILITADKDFRNIKGLDVQLYGF